MDGSVYSVGVRCQGGTAVSTVTVIVTPVNDAPTVPNYTFSTQEDSLW
ncbi:hypothetical protein [Priestia aryabhattai]